VAAMLVIVWSINYEQVVSSIRKMGLKLRVSYLKHNLKSTLAMGMIYLRYYFHEWSRINEFDVVLYTDCDVILNAPLDPIIPKIGVDKIYAVPEGVHHEYFWSLAPTRPYLKAELEEFKKHDILSFNNGIFAFRPTLFMQSHFRAFVSWSQFQHRFQKQTNDPLIYGLIKSS
jgi:lipopolysaccharide biosynthesis glycosyltransferase